MILSRILWVEKYGAKRFSFDRYAIHSGNLSQFDRNFANPCIPPTDISRVGVIITSVVYMEREEKGKRSIEEERVKMRFVIARHVDRGNALFFFFF